MAGAVAADQAGRLPVRVPLLTSALPTGHARAYAHGASAWCITHLWPFLSTLPFMHPLSAAQALRLIMHLGEPLPEARPAWEFPLGATLPFFLLTFAIMCYTNGVGASTGK